MPSNIVRRRGAPVLLAEQFAIAAWLRAGDPLSSIARRCQRPGPETRVTAYGAEGR
jgi:hypothetical protein